VNPTQKTSRLALGHCTAEHQHAAHCSGAEQHVGLLSDVVGAMGKWGYHGLLMGIYRDNSAKIWLLETVESCGLGKSSVETMALPQQNYTFLQMFPSTKGGKW
jgi:hypothetical protein